MKKLFSAALFLSLCAANAFAGADIGVGGKSAVYLYGHMSSRAEGVTKSESKSTFGSRIEVVSLYNILSCGLKHGWVMKTHFCNLQDTDAADISARKIVSGGGELADAMEEISASVNRDAVLPFGGASAARVYAKLAQLEGKDKTFYKKQGATRIMKSKFVGIGIAEMYCQKTTGRILGDSYSCFLLGTTVADSNAPTRVVTTEDPDKNTSQYRYR